MGYVNTEAYSTESILEQAPFAYAIQRMIYSEDKPVNTIIMDANHAFCQLFKKDKEAVIHHELFSLSQSIRNEVDVFIKEFQDVVENHETITVTIYFSNLGKYMTIRAMPYQDKDFITWVTDESDKYLTAQKVQSHQKALFEELSNQKNLLNTIMNAIPNPIFIKNAKGNYIGCNEGFEKFVGRSKQDILLRSDFELFEPELAQLFWDNDEIVRKTKKQRQNEEWVVYPNGSEELFETIKAPLIDEYGELVGTVGISHRVTERRRHLDIIEGERRLFDGGMVTVFVWEYKKGLPVRYVSRNIEILLGYGIETFYRKGFCFENLIHPDDKYRAQKEVEQYIHQGKKSYTQYYRLLHKNGSYRYVYEFTMIDYNERQQVDQLRGYIFDQTHLMKVEHELAKEQQRLSNIIEGTGAATWEWEIQTGVLHVNKQWYETLGYTYEELSPINIQTWEALTHPEDLLLSNKKIIAHFKKETPYYESEFRLRNKRGDWIWFHDRGRVVSWGASGEPLIMSGFHTSIHEKRVAEEIIRQSEKLTALGQLTGGIAHDFNNQLMIMSSYAELMKLNTCPVIQKNYLDKIEGVIYHSADLVKQLLAFSKKGKYEAQVVDIKPVLEGVSLLLSHTMPKTIRIKVNIKHQNLKCLVDRSLVENAIINICLNAKDAMKQGGTIRLSGKSIYFQNYFQTQIGWINPGEYVVITIKDDGMGMSEEIVPHIFEPFFTTKETGTGMGLSAVYGSVRRHEGGVCVKSELGKGTQFDIYLPMTHQPFVSEFKKPLSCIEKLGNKKHKRILIVDDEPLITETIVTFLEEIGHEIMAFNSPLDAITYFEKHAEHLDLCILDIMMPGIDGFEFYEHLKKLKGAIPVIYLSGFSDSFKVSDDIGMDIVAFIEKPVRFEELKAYIDSINE